MTDLYLFDAGDSIPFLVEGYCSATFRRFQQELDRMTGQLDQAAKGQPGDSCLSTDELFLRAAHTYNQALTSDLPEGYCRNFPAYTEQTQAFLAWDTLDAALCDTALLFLTSFVALLKQLTQAAEDFSFLLSATLVGENGRPPGQSTASAPRSCWPIWPSRATRFIGNITA